MKFKYMGYEIEMDVSVFEGELMVENITGETGAVLSILLEKYLSNEIIDAAKEQAEQENGDLMIDRHLTESMD